MKINDRSVSCLTRMTFARELACVALVGIIYVATFGVAHSHRDDSARLVTNHVASITRASFFSSQVSLYNHSQRYKCLICLFHQELFNSIVQSPIFIVQDSRQVAFISEPPILYHSAPIASGPIARLSGRAPPLD
jgi:hypothetical protein